VFIYRNRKKGDPQTPDKTRKQSKRAWDGRIKSWRRALHGYDPKDGPDQIDSDDTENIDETSSAKPATDAKAIVSDIVNTAIVASSINEVNKVLKNCISSIKI
jgi:hypothetical protein